LINKVEKNTRSADMKRVGIWIISVFITTGFFGSATAGTCYEPYNDRYYPCEVVEYYAPDEVVEFNYGPSIDEYYDQNRYRQPQPYHRYQDRNGYHSSRGNYGSGGYHAGGYHY
jgi:hypothetical protein